jgi:hypothetical protein
MVRLKKTPQLKYDYYFNLTTSRETDIVLSVNSKLNIFVFETLHATGKMAERSKAPDSSANFPASSGAFWSRKRRGFESPSCQHCFFLIITVACWTHTP